MLDWGRCVGVEIGREGEVEELFDREGLVYETLNHFIGDHTSQCSAHKRGGAVGGVEEEKGSSCIEETLVLRQLDLRRLGDRNGRFLFGLILSG